MTPEVVIAAAQKLMIRDGLKSESRKAKTPSTPPAVHAIWPGSSGVRPSMTRVKSMKPPSQMESTAA